VPVAAWYNVGKFGKVTFPGVYRKGKQMTNQIFKSSDANVNKMLSVLSNKIEAVNECFELVDALNAEFAANKLTFSAADLLKKQNIFSSIADSYIDTDEFPNMGDFIRNLFELRSEIINDLTYLVSFDKIADDQIISFIKNFCQSIDSKLNSFTGISVDDLGDIFDTAEVSEHVPSKVKQDSKFVNVNEVLRIREAHKQRMLIDPEYRAKILASVSKRVNQCRGKYKQQLLKLEAQYSLNPTAETLANLERVRALHKAQMNKYTNYKSEEKTSIAKHLSTFNRMVNVKLNDLSRDLISEMYNVISTLEKSDIGEEVYLSIDINSLSQRNEQFAKLLEKALLCKKDELEVIAQGNKLGATYLVEKKNELSNIIADMRALYNSIKEDFVALEQFTTNEKKEKLLKYKNWYNTEYQIAKQIINLFQKKYSAHYNGKVEGDYEYNLHLSTLKATLTDAISFISSQPLRKTINNIISEIKIA
jgi:hypothetical protein